MISDPLAVFVTLAAIVFVSVKLEERFASFRALGAALVGILLAMLAANLGLLTEASPTYGHLSGTGVNLAIAFILLGVNLRSVMQAGPLMLVAFAIGAVGTAVGATVAALLLEGMIGPETPKLAAQYTGTYTGGGMNFTALGRALDTSQDLFTAAMAADIIVTALWLVACLSVPLLLGRRRTETPTEVPIENPVTRDPVEATGGFAEATGGSAEATGGLAEAPLTLERQLRESGRSVPMLDLAALITIAVGAVWVSGEVVAWSEGSWIENIPQVLWITTMVLAAAQVPAIKRLTGSALLGNYLLLLFLASNGAQSVIANIFEIGPAVFYFAAITVAVHGVVIFGVGSILRIDLATLAIASQANVGGAGSAIALASARGHAERLLPGVAVGLLGYAVGTYSGYGIYLLLAGAPPS